MNSSRWGSGITSHVVSDPAYGCAFGERSLGNTAVGGSFGLTMAFPNQTPPPSAGLKCPDWRAKTSKNLMSAQAASTIADTHRQTSLRAHELTRYEKDQQHAKVNSAFQNKIVDSKGMVNDLRDRIRSVESSIALSKKNNVALHEASHAKKAPLELCDSRLDLRHRERPLSESKRDYFEIALSEEKDILSWSIQMLNEQACKTDNVIQDLAALQAELMEDLKVKTHALQIDQDCVQAASNMNRYRRGHHDAPCDELLNPGSMGGDHPEQQEGGRKLDMMDRIRCAKQREEEAQQIRAESDQLMMHTEQQCSSHNVRMNEEMNNNISELNQMIQRLRQGICHQQDRIGRTMEVLGRTSGEMIGHNAPVGLVKNRLNMRGQRYERENIHDPVRAALDTQFTSLQKNLGHLQVRQDNERSAHDELQQTLREMEADLADKTKALETDMHCKNILKSVDMASFQSWSMAKTLGGLGGSSINSGQHMMLPDLSMRGGGSTPRRSPTYSPKAAGSARGW